MIPAFLRRLLGRIPATPAQATPARKSEALAVDPLDPIKKRKDWAQHEPTFTLRSVKDFAVFDGMAGEGTVTTAKIIGDAALKLKSQGAIMDDADGGTGMLKAGPSEYTVPVGLQSWYMAQGFIGYQSCAIIAQHWLVDKACSMAGEDAARNGWVIKARGGDDLEDADHDQLIEADKKYKVKENLIELNRFKNIFGIRVAIFKVDSDDPDYYEKPFNIDGVTENSYKGISQIDPYWMMPVMTSVGTSDPSAIGFYDPTYWVISGKKYHKSHLCIVRGPQPADILKPTYIFGGIPLTQRIYERVYAAERTANEAPLMAMSKRTMAIHADLDKVMADQDAFEQRLLTWIRYRDNHGVKVLGKEEAMEQFDTNMSDFDSIIMNQYQLVAAIARVPATKLLGTSPKGFNATGEFEMKSYHEELESIQEHVMMPMLERHYDILCRSEGIMTEVEVVCNSVDSMTAKERAELNDLKAKTGTELINNGSLSPDEERNRIRDDEHSGYNRLQDTGGEEEPGMSPENIAALQKSGAQQEEAQAGAVMAKPGEPGSETTPGNENGSESDTVEGAQANSNGALQALIPVLLKGIAHTQATPTSPDPVQAAMLMLVHALATGKQPQDGPAIQGTKPGTRGTARPSVVPSSQRAGDAKVVGIMHPSKLPKIRLDGLNIVIENPRGTVREGMNMDGSEWSVEMPDHYGFIKGFDGADGDEVDCFVGPNARSKDVFVISQNDSEGAFDEYKCMIGYDDEEKAVAAYHAAHDENFEGYGSCQKMSMDDFKSWLESGDCAVAPIMDAGEFKEGEHPRASNGQFGSGGAGSSEVAKKPWHKKTESAGLKSIGLGETVTTPIAGKLVIANGPGKPVTFFHGGPSELKGGKPSGLSFFTTEKGAAKEYADQFGGDGKVHSAHLSITNPATAKDLVSAADKVGVDWTAIQGYDDEISKEQIAFGLLTKSQLSQKDQNIVDKVVEQLKKDGFDGAAFSDDFAAGSGKSISSLCAFNDDQIVK